MRNLILPAIVLVLLIAGFQIYFEVAKKDFDKSLPQVPEPVEQQNESARSKPLDVEDAEESSKETGVAEGAAAAADTSVHPHTHEDDADVDVDWRDDTQHSHTHEVEPWPQIHSHESEEAEGPPPKVWFEIADPYERAEARRAQLIKQFGDIPAVHTNVDISLKLQLGEVITLDEEIALYEATYSLWPHEETLKSLKSAQADKAAASRARAFSH